MKGNQMLEKMLDTQDGIDYDAEDEQFIITMLDDIDVMKQLYDTNPMVREFVNRELRARKELVHGIDHDPITGYEVLGFLYRHKGEEYTLPREIF